MRANQKLDYHSTECIYSPTAYRGHARALVKDLESIRPSAIVDIVRRFRFVPFRREIDQYPQIYSGEAMAASLKLSGKRAGGDLRVAVQPLGMKKNARPVQRQSRSFLTYHKLT